MQLGIDFGTTRTVVAAADRGNYPILAFESPDGGTYDWFPSLIAVRGDERLYGWEAWSRQQDPGWTTIRSIKRIFDDAGPHTTVHVGEQSLPHAVVGRDGLRHSSCAAVRTASNHDRRARQCQ